MYAYCPTHSAVRLPGVLGLYPVVLAYPGEIVVLAPIYNLDDLGRPSFETGSPIEGARLIGKPDMWGDCLISLPVAAIKEGLTQEEIEEVGALDVADSALLASAR